MTTDVYEELRKQALARIDGEGLDPATDVHAVRRLLEGTVEDYQRGAHLGEGRALADPEAVVTRLERAVSGRGPLMRLLDRDDLEEVFVEGDRITYLEAGGLLKSALEPSTEEENKQAIQNLISRTDRRLDAASPIVQARVLGGTARLTAVIPPISDHLSATIRRYAIRRQTLDSLVQLGSLSRPAADLMRLAMATSCSVLVSGPPGSGKTSFLSALISSLPIDTCVRVCEEVREINVPLLHGSYYETRPPSLEGSGAIDLRDLVKVTLAMRPDLIAVGEVRGAEAFELTRAVNAGCGMVCTIHANSAADALDALVNAALMAGENVTDRVVRKVFSSSIDFVVHLDRSLGPGGERILRETMEIRSLVPSLHDDFSSEALFVRDRPGGRLQWTGALPSPELRRRLERAAPGGVDLARVMREGMDAW